ncbi:diguanylate cyclase domain-containing protein [Candidatus Omnitrophota bacterium]
MKITMQSRITTMLIVFVVVLISAFVFIQLQNQLRIITIFNSLKAKLTAQILKDALQKPPSEETETSNFKKAFDPTLAELSRSGLINTVHIYAKDGSFITGTAGISARKRSSSSEVSNVKEALSAVKAGKNFISNTDKATQQLQLFIPISTKDKNYSHVARLDIPLSNMNEAMAQVYVPVIVTGIVVVIACVFFGLALTKRLVGPIVVLNTATKEVAGGDLNLRIHMHTNDELEELADTFNQMAIELKKMRAKAENANPLTKLPGNIVIQEQTEDRIQHNKLFTVIYCDLDNFKAFNDKYGIHAGDQAIMLTATIFKEVIEQKGNPDDFVGHEGGDDFLLLTTPNKAQEIGDYITAEFDKQIRALYNKEDLERGFIFAKARHGEQVVQFPIMTISLAGVTNEIRHIVSYGEVTNIAAEVKKKAKMTPGSCLVIDKRKIPWPPDMPRPTA